MKLAFVVQRYGEDIIGGSETLCRLLAERLSKYHEIHVLTTCAKDYVTWKNEYPAGLKRMNNVQVRRFRTKKQRSLREFNKLTYRIFYEAHSDENELEWIKEQGPYSPQLVDYIAAHKNSYDLFVFFTYRYYPTFFGLPHVYQKSVLIPTAESDLTIELRTSKAILNLPRAVIYLTNEEKDLVTNSSNNRNCPYDIIGLGVDAHPDIKAVKFKEKYGIRYPFVLYLGRIDINKGCDTLFEYFIRYKKEKSDLKLILVGDPKIDIPKHPDIIHLGSLSEKEKFEAIKAAELVVVPSFYESYSIVTIEALSMRKPILVNGNCAVLKGHAARSNAGLWYEDYDEFRECMNLLLSNKKLRKKLGENGKRYVEKNYSWNVVEEKYTKILEKLKPTSRNQ